MTSIDTSCLAPRHPRCRPACEMSHCESWNLHHDVLHLSTSEVPCVRAPRRYDLLAAKKNKQIMHSSNALGADLSEFMKR